MHGGLAGVPGSTDVSIDPKPSMGNMISIRKIVGAYILGAGKVMLILGVVNSAVLLMLGIEHAIFWNVCRILKYHIPYIGHMIGVVLLPLLCEGQFILSFCCE